MFFTENTDFGLERVYSEAPFLVTFNDFGNVKLQFIMDIEFLVRSINRWLCPQHRGQALMFAVLRTE